MTEVYSSAEYWSIGDVSLHRQGWSISSFGGSRYDLPPRRGDGSLKFAYRPGAIHKPRLPDPRPIDLIMWMTATDPATGDRPSDLMTQFNDNWDTLRRLVWKPNDETVTLTRRWYLTQSSTKTLVAASAEAILTNTMPPNMTGRYRATFTMQFLLNDPFFFGALETNSCVISTPKSIVNLGHDVAAWSNLEVDFVGPLVNPRLTNTTPAPDVWVQYTGTVASGQTVRLKVGDFRAYRVSDSANLIGSISNSGARHWMGLLPGTNSLTLTASSGSGTAVVRHQPPYV